MPATGGGSSEGSTIGGGGANVLAGGEGAIGAAAGSGAGSGAFSRPATISGITPSRTRLAPRAIPCTPAGSNADATDTGAVRRGAGPPTNGTVSTKANANTPARASGSPTIARDSARAIPGCVESVNTADAQRQRMRGRRLVARSTFSRYEV